MRECVRQLSVYLMGKADASKMWLPGTASKEQLRDAVGWIAEVTNHFPGVAAVCIIARGLRRANSGSKGPLRTEPAAYRRNDRAGSRDGPRVRTARVPGRVLAARGRQPRGRGRR